MKILWIIVNCYLCFLYSDNLKPEAPINKTHKYNLVICAIFQNETFFLKQWIEFHTLLGVDHFYLYNHQSTDNYLEILEPYIQSGLVDLIHWPAETHNQQEYLTRLQLPAYNHCLRVIKQTAHWAAFIDLDEFICPVRHDNLIEFLEEYSAYAGLAVNWQTFGTSHIDKLPQNELIIEHFTWKAPFWWEMNKYIKMLVQPMYVESFSCNPHYCCFKEGYFAVNSEKEPLYDLKEVQPILIDTIRIHHYWFGDRNWFIHNKLPRREQWGVSIPSDYLDTFIDSFNQEQDKTMLKFAPQLKKKINKQESIP